MVTRASPRLVISVSAASRMRPAELTLDTVSSRRVVFCLDELDTMSSIAGNEARNGERDKQPHGHRQIGITRLAGAAQPPHRRAPLASARRPRRAAVPGTAGHPAGEAGRPSA